MFSLSYVHKKKMITAGISIGGVHDRRGLMQSSRFAVRIHNDQNKNANESGGELIYLTEKASYEAIHSPTKESLSFPILDPRVSSNWKRRFAASGVRDESRAQFPKRATSCGPDSGTKKTLGEKRWGKRTHVRREGKRYQEEEKYEKADSKKKTSRYRGE